MFELPRRIYAILNKQERRQFLFLTFAFIAMAVIEVAGIASIMPFMAVLAKPQVIETNGYLHWIYQILGFTSRSTFLVFLGFLFFTVIVMSSGIKIISLWLELSFVHFRLVSLSTRLLYTYLAKPYEFYLNQNTAILGKNLFQEVSQFIHFVLRPCVQIMSRLVVVCLVLGFLLFVDPVLAITIGTLIGGAYSIIYTLAQRKLKRLGEERFNSTSLRTQSACEAMAGIKELKVLGRERYYFDLFSHHVFKTESSWRSSGLFSQLPSYLMEVITFGGILGIVMYFLLLRRDIGLTLPIVALYAFAGYRVMPAIQGIFSAVSTIRFNFPTVEVIYDGVAGMSGAPPQWQRENVQALSFQEQIELKGLHFMYPGALTPVLRDLNLVIKKNTSVGIVGSTGSGKTTMVDILLGLLSPQEGELLVDYEPVTSGNMAGWRKNLGYVPQSIFLCDGSISSNIAFGIASESVDMEAVEHAARIANIHDFIVNELPNGYATGVGEQGVRLSGGQRQRIGIARALYHDPAVLIMDEATSALDGITEDAVIQAIRTLAGKKTIITIAHRLSTLRDCDVIYVMEEGRAVEQGTYAELYSVSTRFRAMADTVSMR